MSNNIEVVLSPSLLPFHVVKNKTVVVVDILRATSSMCVAFETGVQKILPVSSVDECRVFKDFDFLCAAERDAVKVDGFDLGNSPFEFQNPLIQGKNIAFTTTNGTKAIQLAKELGAKHIVIGSFLNMEAVAEYICNLNNDTIVLCAGWKDKFNLEDSLFAGALVNKVATHFNNDCDAALAMQQLYLSQQHRLLECVRESSHAKRFQLLHIQTDDVAFCLQHNITRIVPVLEGAYIIKAL